MNRHHKLFQAARRNLGTRHSHSRPERKLRCEHLEDRRMLAVVTVDTDQDVVDLDDDVTSLREAIFATNTVAGADEIVFDFGHDGPATILLTQGELAITDALTITGPGAELLTIDASGNDPTPESSLLDEDPTNDGDGSRIFIIFDEDFYSKFEVTISGLSMTGGDATRQRSESKASFNIIGSAIFCREELNVLSSTLYENAGGAAIVTYGDTSIVDSVVRDNVTYGSGGGIFFPDTGNTLRIANSRITGNQAIKHGGGLAVGCDTVITNSEISDNIAGGAGGGIYSFSGETTIRVVESTITGNIAEGIRQSSGGGGGGGIFKRTRDKIGILLIQNSVVSENSAIAAEYARGGGIFASQEHVTIVDSRISNNRTTGDFSSGGGVSLLRSSSLTVSNSSITGNSTSGERSPGGGIHAGDRVGSGRPTRHVSISNSLIQNNTTHGRDSGGGGIYTLCHEATITNSTISSNEAGKDAFKNHRNLTHDDSPGGGIALFSGSSVIENTTISLNEASGHGGGLFSNSFALTLAKSTVAFNRADADTSRTSSGGGLFIEQGIVDLNHTIVAKNSIFSAGPDITGYLGAVIVPRDSLIGNNLGSGLVETPIGEPDANGNLIGYGSYNRQENAPIDPFLDRLADNGGSTPTHALLPGSPAINAGDPSFQIGMEGLPEFDQRGAPFARVAGGRIDIGAYEVQSEVGNLVGDFDGDHDVDGADLLAWQRGYGNTAALTNPSGDVTGNGIVNENDLAVWEVTFGRQPSTADSSMPFSNLTSIAEDRFSARMAPSSEFIELAITFEQSLANTNDQSTKVSVLEPNISENTDVGVLTASPHAINQGQITLEDWPEFLPEQQETKDSPDDSLQTIDELFAKW